MIGYLFLTILALSLVAYLVGAASGRRFQAAGGEAVHSLPSYHGAYVAIWVGVRRSSWCSCGSCSRTASSTPCSGEACPSR